MRRTPEFLSFARLMKSPTFDTSPICSSICSAASFAPPCAGPHRQAIPAAMQAKGLAPDEPARRTVEVDAFCSWSAWRMKMRRIAFSMIGLTTYGSAGEPQEIPVEVVGEMAAGGGDQQ